MKEQKTSFQHTYFVQDMSDGKEVQRLVIQDAMITRAMGGTLPEQEDPTRFQHIIDIGCGTGGWLIETAKTYPSIEHLVGIDTSSQAIHYARELAAAEQVNDHVEFRICDALLMAEFPKHYFSLLNQRLGWSYLRTWEWPTMLTRYLHMTQPGGTIRITESDAFGTSTSPALTQLFDLARGAFYTAGHLFTPERDSVTNKLPELFHNYGIQDVQTRSVLLDYRAGTKALDGFVEDTKLAFRTIIPFLSKWGRIPDNYDEIYQQALDEMQRPGCITTWEIVTVWGTTR